MNRQLAAYGVTAIVVGMAVYATNHAAGFGAAGCIIAGILFLRKAIKKS